MAEILKTVSHDSINRFLNRECYDPKDLFDFIVGQGLLELSGGILSGDDTAIEKPYSDPEAIELLGYYWSSKHGKPVLGIPLITLYYTSPNGVRVPITYRIYDKREGKTKNQYLQAMIQEVIQWGVQPKTFTSDAWYASKSNLNLVKNSQLGFLVGVAKNRLVRLLSGAEKSSTVDMEGIGISQR
jgi:DDE superfamily endonuclease